MISRISGRVIVTVTNLKENNSLVTIIEGKITDIIRNISNYSALGFTIKDDVSPYHFSFISLFYILFLLIMEKNIINLSIKKNLMKS